MRRYSERHNCPKCDFGGVATKHVRDLFSGMSKLRRICGRCGYVWSEAPLDAPKSKVTVA